MKRPALASALMTSLVLAYWFIFRPWYFRWGATPREQAMPLPGDDIAPDANSVSTRAITIRAPASQIFPWLVQIGQGRGGMYSYEWLENLAGCDLHNVYEIRPELQQVQPGQVLRMGPEGYPFYRVVSVDPNQSFVLQPGNPATKEPAPASWAMVVNERPDGTSRLIMRQRMRVDPGLGNFIAWKVITDPLTFIMEQKMMRVIRDLAES